MMPRNADVPCADCGNLMWRGTGSLPPGQATCRPCRKVARVTVAPAAIRKPRATSGQRGYDYRHQQARTWYLSQFTDGDPCARCGEPMTDLDPKDLDHDDADRSRYLGLSHRWCNRNTAGRGRRAKPYVVSDCPMCGTTFKHKADQRTCSRVCGWEYRKQAA